MIICNMYGRVLRNENILICERKKKLTKQSLSSGAVHHKNSEDVTRQVCRGCDEAIRIYCEVTDKKKEDECGQEKDMWRDMDGPEKTNKTQHINSYFLKFPE